jgi:sulfide:quinone oxidoreductase
MSFAQKLVHHQVIIVGGGAAGITVAAQLINRDSALDVLIIEPSSHHYYQPAWTLVGAGRYSYEKTVRPEKECIPRGVKWLQDSVVSFDANNNQLQTRNGQRLSYEALVGSGDSD